MLTKIQKKKNMPRKNKCINKIKESFDLKKIFSHSKLNPLTSI